jgi:hypothetical protein
MRMVTLPGIDRPASVLGFGCASLGSRVSARQGLQALQAAHEQGVNWFDLAPAYGAGEAELIFGQFLRGRRDALHVCSKVGLVPPQRNALVKLAYGLARPVAGAVQGARKLFRRMPATRNVSVSLTPALLRSSLERSLQRLGTDRLDVFALHKPRHEDIGRDDILSSLQRLREEGKALRIAVSGDAQAATLALRHPEVYGVLQVADDPMASPLPGLQPLAQGRCALITHSILGVGGNLERLSGALRRAPVAARDALRSAGYPDDPAAAAAQLLVDRALAANDGGVVLLSMFGDRHRRANLTRAATAPRMDAIREVAELLAQGEAAA